MQVIETRLPGVMIVEPDVFPDNRGFFMESYNRTKYTALGIGDEFCQDNHSRSTVGVLRGLHYQKLPGQAKLVRVTTGEVLDVPWIFGGDRPRSGSGSVCACRTRTNASYTSLSATHTDTAF